LLPRPETQISFTVSNFQSFPRHFWAHDGRESPLSLRSAISAASALSRYASFTPPASPKTAES
jgi:hypothetical protein